jgi:hypothetical protein
LGRGGTLEASAAAHHGASRGSTAAAGHAPYLPFAIRVGIGSVSPPSCARGVPANCDFRHSFPAVNGGDAAVLYCFTFFYLAFAGGGLWY